MPKKPLQLLLALGVGQIQVRSALNQVLDAEIPLLLAGPAEAAGVTARLAPAQVFAQNGVERPALLTELVFSVHTGADGRGFIKVTSKQPIREPLLDFLIQVEWPKGQVMREFAVLLDPPARAARRLAMSPVTQPLQPAVPARPPVAHHGTATYGPVPFGETLWNIASRVRPDPAISVQRMMQVLLDTNPRAFWKHNVDGLRAGVTLRIPSAQEIDPVRFPEEVSRQLAARQQVPLTPPAAKGTPAPAGKPQVRLVPPEVAEGGQRPAQTAAALPQPGVSPATPALTMPFAIRLKDNHPTLRLAGLEELRQRMSTLKPQEEAKAAQELQAAPSAKAPEPAPPVVPQPKPPEPAPAVKAGEPQPLPEPQQRSPAGGSAPQPEMHLQEALPEALVPRPGTSRETPEEAGTLQPEAGPEPRAPVIRPETPPPPPVAASTATPLPPPVAASTATPPPATTVPAPVVPTPPAKPLPAAQESGSEGLLSDWLEPVRLALLGALSLLLGGGAWYWLQRRSQQEESEETQIFKGIIPVPAAPTTKETVVLPTQATYKQTEPVTRTPPFRLVPNPLERADLLLAVGNYAEADNILRQALTVEPENTALLAKRLDVHFAAHDTEAFAKEAEVLHEKLKDKADPLWSRVTQMGRELCPGHTLFSGADELFAVAATQTATSPKGVDTADKVASGEQIDAVFAESDTALFANLAESAEPPTQHLRDSLAEPDWQLSDLDQPTITSEAFPEEEPTQPPAWDDRFAAPREPDWQSPELNRPTAATEPLRQDEEEESIPSLPLTPLADLEFELDTLFTYETTNSRLSVIPPNADAAFTGLEGGETAAGKEPVPALEEPLQGLDLTPESSDKKPPAASGRGTLRGEDYVETKLDLAMAYLDMGDSVGARSLLEEVLKEGNDSQKQRAQASIAKLG
jgi:pilus assembly protein FimV